MNDAKLVTIKFPQRYDADEYGAADSQGTQVFVGDTLVMGVKSITIDIKPDSVITANISVIATVENIDALARVDLLRYAKYDNDYVCDQTGLSPRRLVFLMAEMAEASPLTKDDILEFGKELDKVHKYNPFIPDYDGEK